jgi:4-hydroxythreonine-4-phosphate dehydrogenase
VFGITIGDPAGVGPEIVVKAMNDMSKYQEKYVVYGAVDILQYYVTKFGLAEKIVEIQDPDEYKEGYLNVIDPNHLTMDQYEIGKCSGKCGDAAYQYVVSAIDASLSGKLKGVVTGPLNKEALHLGGHNFDGHTEIFATRTNTQKYCMMFYGPMKIAHVSTHCSLRTACDRVKKQRVLDVIELLNQALQMTGMKKPLIAVAGLNPHAGEHGLFGTEEIEEVIPAIEEAKKEGINVVGPIPPDSCYKKHIDGEYDAVVAMYHDQGHIAAKLGNRDMCVNCTIGLPIIRTSVDHGTAFDIAGTGLADETNMEQSMLCAEKFLKGNVKF